MVFGRGVGVQQGGGGGPMSGPTQGLSGAQEVQQAGATAGEGPHFDTRGPHFGNVFL